MSDDKTQYQLRQYETNDDMQAGLNEMSGKGYSLHSWKLQVDRDTWFFVCVFEIAACAAPQQS